MVSTLINLICPHPASHCLQYSQATGREANFYKYFFYTSAPVTIKELITELHDVISWFQLGIYLDISSSELMKIRADHREKTNDCKTEMLVTWLKQTTDASWSAVVRALVGIRMGALAQKVAVKYGEIVPHTKYYLVLKGQFAAEVKIWIKESIP